MICCGFLELEVQINKNDSSRNFLIESSPPVVIHLFGVATLLTVSTVSRLRSESVINV